MSTVKSTPPSDNVQQRSGIPGREPAPTKLGSPQITWPGRVTVPEPSLVHPVQWGGPRLVGIDPQDGVLDDSGVVVTGDNRVAMAALLAGAPGLPSYAGKVKLCYLDPPYNTGARFSTYEDALSLIHI